MIKTWLTTAALAALATSSLASAQSAQPPHSLAEDAAAFGARESVAAPALSPDGATILYLTPGPGHSTVAVTANVVTGAVTRVIASDGNPEQLRWCDFSGSARLVCRISATVDRSGNLVGFQRLMSLRPDGTDAKLLGQQSSQYDAWLRQFDAAIIDWLPARDGIVMMAREYVPEEGKMGSYMIASKAGLGVDEVDTATLRSKTVETPKPGVSRYMSDDLGHLRLLEIPVVEKDGQLTDRVSYSYRGVGGGGWTTLGTFSDQDFQPLAIDASSDSLYLLKPLNGRLALHAMKLDGSQALRLVADNPRVDIDDVVRIGKGQKVVGYSFAEDARSVVYWDAEFAGLARSLSGALPGKPAVDLVDSSEDGNILLIFAGTSSDAGRYYVFDRRKKTLAEAMQARPELNGRPMAEVKSVTAKAANGSPMLAYLTLPPGKDAHNLPAVILPHGGPSARDEWGFDWLPQFLAARGYAVLQPQFRGSAGFGREWLNGNGFRNWRDSIGDISASARWLTAEGIADPKRLAIVGWSYGGYAALQSAATEPSLYKAAVAIAPVTDFALVKREAQGFTNRDVTAREIGSGPEIAAGSPLRHASAIKVPVLLVHGDLDSNVGIEQSVKMDGALKAAGGQSQLLTFKGLDHQLDDSNARRATLSEIGSLLERTIGH